MKSALNLLGLKSKGASSELGLEEFLSQLPAQMGFDVSFTRTDSEEKGICFEVNGEDLDSFLGDSSDMLDALSHISMRVLRKTEGLTNAPSAEVQDALRVVFDSKGFRDKKAQELRDLAGAQRQKVLDSGGKPSYIPALGPSERKIIHTHLADLGEVVSESIGRGNFKRIRVRLKDDSTLRRQPAPGEEASGPRPDAGNREGGAAPRHAGGGGGGNRGSRGGRGRGGQNRGGGRGGNGQNRRPGGGGNGDGRPFDPNVRPQEPEVDDNIGNRLRPGEEPLFGFSTPSKGDDFDSNH